MKFFKKLRKIAYQRATYIGNVFLGGLLYRYKHHTPLCDDIILGALPIKSKGKDITAIKASCHRQKSLGLVVGVVEDFELSAGLLLKPIKETEWKKNGVEFTRLSMVDTTYKLPRNGLLTLLSKIDATTKQNKTVYIHCNVGKGRSTLFVAIFLALRAIKANNVNLNDRSQLEALVSKTFADIKKLRPQAISSTERKAEVIDFIYNTKDDLIKRDLVNESSDIQLTPTPRAKSTPRSSIPAHCSSEFLL